MPTRSAHADWNGSVQDGHGNIDLAFGAQPYSFKTRIMDEETNTATTNPEELMGAALAGCYSMSLAARLSSRDIEPEHIDTTCKVTLSPSGVGFKISRMTIECKAKITGITDAEFQEHADIAKTNCPISNALIAVPISLNATLISE